ncbi:MAG: GNAT family N-acetyltransferase [Flavobacteriales bacterium]|nr:GNAT family N-acetyltransferase [Flavobacteriales bacterium]
MIQVMPNVEWHIYKFEELKVTDLYNICALRNEVFVVEQNCIYQDLDGKDHGQDHILCMENKSLAGYARIIAPNVIYKDPSIGRIVVKESYRKLGLGRTLVEKSINHIHNKFGNIPIRISAQVYLNNFYSELGFKKVGEQYLEDGIPHVEMILD